MDPYRHLGAKDNKQGYIKSLIRADMQRNSSSL